MFRGSEVQGSGFRGSGVQGSGLGVGSRIRSEKVIKECVFAVDSDTYPMRRILDKLRGCVRMGLF